MSAGASPQASIITALQLLYFYLHEAGRASGSSQRKLTAEQLASMEHNTNTANTVFIIGFPWDASPLNLV